MRSTTARIRRAVQPRVPQISKDALRSPSSPPGATQTWPCASCTAARCREQGYSRFRYEMGGHHREGRWCRSDRVPGRQGRGSVRGRSNGVSMEMAVE